PAGHHPPTEVVLQVLAPLLLAAGGVEADQVAPLAQRVDAVARDGRRRAGALVVAAGPADLGRPDLLAVQVQRVHVAGVLAVAHGVDAPAGDGDAGVARADALRLPRQRRPVLRPLLEQPRVGREVVPPRPAPL